MNMLMMTNDDDVSPYKNQKKKNTKKIEQKQNETIERKR